MPQAQHPPVPTSLFKGLWSSIRHSPPLVWDQIVGSNMYKEEIREGAQILWKLEIMMVGWERESALLLVKRAEDEMGENRGSSHYCHGNTDKSNSAANTTLCEFFSETEPKTGRNGDMKPRVWGSLRQPASLLLCLVCATLCRKGCNVCPWLVHAGCLGHREQQRLVQRWPFPAQHILHGTQGSTLK